MRSTRTALCLALVTGVGLFASTHQRIDSRWRDRDITVDGDNGDWPGPLRPVEENRPILAAAANDGQFLYLVLSTSDVAVRRQILRQGLTVWFDPAGGDKKHFGIKFPVGVMPEDPPSRRRGGARPDPGERRRPADAGSADPAQADTTQPDPVNRLEIYGPKKNDAHNFVTEMAPGIAVKVGQVEGYFVYELKVPIATGPDWPYAIEAKPGAVVGLGLETPQMERPSGIGRGGLGGFGGRRAGGGMRGRRGGNGDQFEPVKPLKAWATIQLARQK
jgi:hypothetical protein